MNKYQLWETIYYQKGKEYLEKKIDYFHQLIGKEEEAEEYDIQLSGDEMKDLSVYESQINDYRETIDIIKTVIKNCSSGKRKASYPVSPPVRMKQDFKIKKTENNFKNIAPAKVYDDLRNDTVLSPPKIELKKKPKQKIKINYRRIIFTLAIFTFLILLLINLIRFGFDLFTDVSTAQKIVYASLGFLVIFLILSESLKRRTRREYQKSQYYFLLAKKLNCVPDKLSLSGYYAGNFIKLSKESKDNKVFLKLIFTCNRKNIPDMIISTFLKPNTKMQRVFSDVFAFDSRMKLYCNNRNFVKSILTDSFITLILGFLKINKNLDFSIIDGKFQYYDFFKILKSIQDVEYYEKLIKLFSSLSKIIENAGSTIQK